MSDATRTPPSRLERQVQAYHDGELSGFARWRFERRLRRSAELRREVEALGVLGGWLREAHPEPEVDLWDRIAMRLPAEDARRAASPEPPARGARWVWPAAALASLGVAALVVARWVGPEPPAYEGVVRWIDSGNRGVIVLESSPDTTIIWVFDDAAEAADAGERRDLV